MQLNTLIDYISEHHRLVLSDGELSQIYDTLKSWIIENDNVRISYIQIHVLSEDRLAIFVNSTNMEVSSGCFIKYLYSTVPAAAYIAVNSEWKRISAVQLDLFGHFDHTPVPKFHLFLV